MPKETDSTNIVLDVRPVTSNNWREFETLFGKNGACGGCWCMWFRVPKREFDRQKGEGNRLALKKLVDAGTCPGLLGFYEGRPVGWCSVAPRDHFPRLMSSRVVKPIDDKPVWSVVCFFIAKDYRKKGVSAELLRGAVRYVREQGGLIVEGYAVEPKKGKTADTFAYQGPVSIYRRVGFTEVARRSETRPIMRYYID